VSADAERSIAAFDFDGTLSRRDTLMPFLARAVGRAAVWRAMAAEGAVVARQRRFDRDDAKVRALRRLLAGEEAQRVAELGRAYAGELQRQLRPELVERVAWHRSEGHELVMVSASLAVYLEPLAEELGFDHVIAVELVADADGRLTGEMVHPNVRGAEKVRRIEAWFDGRAPTVMWAYGDSAGDEPLLALAQHPTWVGRRARRPRRSPQN
jgi:HAD superfamily hydrolase (TIGR01490 family)